MISSDVKNVAHDPEKRELKVVVFFKEDKGATSFDQTNVQIELLKRERTTDNLPFSGNNSCIFLSNFEGT